MDINNLLKCLDNINETKQTYQDNTSDFIYKVTITMNTQDEMDNDQLRTRIRNILQNELYELALDINVKDVNIDPQDIV